MPTPDLGAPPRWPQNGHGIAALAVVALGAAVGCTSFGVAHGEFDAVSGLEDVETWPDRVDYRPDPLRYPWLFRQLDHLGVGRAVRVIFDVERFRDDIENPSGFARESVEVLGERAGSSLWRVAVATRRLLWVAELDQGQPMNQAVALHGLGKLMAKLEFDPRAMQLPQPDVTTEERITGWLATLDAGWPLQRPGRMDDEARTTYEAALRELTALPHPSSAGQRALIGAMRRLYELESDPALVEPTRQALLLALFHGMALGLRRGLYDPSPVVREAAIQEIRRLGGPDAVPFILALIARPSSSAARGVNRYDDDLFVRLLLVRLCGQLAGDRALATHANGPAPVEMLYETYFADTDAGLRRVAQEALARALQRPISFDDDWPERWWRDEYLVRRPEQEQR